MTTLYKVIGLCLLAAGCTQSNTEERTVMGYYSPPWQSGLKAIRPYPNPDSVCKEIGYNMVSKDFYDESKLLVGCPKTEQVMINDRVAEGGQVVGYIHQWTMIHMPRY